MSFVEIEGFSPNIFYLIGFMLFTLAFILMVLHDPLEYRDKNEGHHTSNTYIDSGHDCGE
ncbi:hypothetical protein R50073_01160 [Maricurvus nonylphenolicus]